MKQLLIISSVRGHAADIGRQLAGSFAVRMLGLDEFAREAPDELILVDIDLNDTACVDDLRTWLQRRPKGAMTLFAIDKASRIQTVRAYSIGATDLVIRPLRHGMLLDKLQRHGASTARGSSPREVCGVVAGITALQDLFVSACGGPPLNLQLIAAAGEALVNQIEEFGFADWVKAIRVHHDQTYQHCLLVSGATAAFAQHLGFNIGDRQRVAMAGLLHDAGKVKIPLAILEKPSALDDREMTTVKEHTIWGHDALKDVDGLHPEMLDMVLHHHEYLDGSGYPHGLPAAEISDLTRLVTISDIFGALIERRAYRPPMSGAAAYQILLDMGSRLDRDLVRAFKPLSRLQVA